MKRALITGITGQTGSYLAEHLLSIGYEVHGLVRRLSSPNHDRIRYILHRIRLWDGDLTDLSSVLDIMRQVKPHEVYNLAAQSFVPTSWEQPLLTGDVNALGVTRLLEAIRKTDNRIKFYQASTSEMFGQVNCEPQNEDTPFHPRSPYGVAKTYAHYITQNYRESYGLFACCGISFNHESPRRGLEFVTRKISRAAAMIKSGKQSTLELGNIGAERDWGFAGDYVVAMRLMLQQSKPRDFVIATGVKHSVQDFASEAFKNVGLDWREHVVLSSDLLRPAEVTTLCGDSTKLRNATGWSPRVSFEELVRMMVDSDVHV